MTKASQPMLAGWVNKLNEPQPIRLVKRKIGACAATSDSNKQQKVTEDLIKFENRIINENTKFNKTAMRFNRDNQTLIIKSVNVNSVISLQKMNKVTDLLNDAPDVLRLTDTLVKEYKLYKFRNKERNVFATKTVMRGVAIIANRALNPEMFERNEVDVNFLSVTFDAAGKK